MKSPLYNDELVNRLRMYADDLHSHGGFNGYSSAMSSAADEIVRLREMLFQGLCESCPAFPEPEEGLICCKEKQS